jgi:hypothetical protein
MPFRKGMVGGFDNAALVEMEEDEVILGERVDAVVVVVDGKKRETINPDRFCGVTKKAQQERRLWMIMVLDTNNANGITFISRESKLS